VPPPGSTPPSAPYYPGTSSSFIIGMQPGVSTEPRKSLGGFDDRMPMQDQHYTMGDATPFAVRESVDPYGEMPGPLSGTDSTGNLTPSGYQTDDDRAALADMMDKIRANKADIEARTREAMDRGNTSEFGTEHAPADMQSRAAAEYLKQWFSQ
jgi:hypothetical protein